MCNVCHISTGHITGGSDILSLLPTTSVSSAHTSNITLSNADKVHVTITCANNLDLLYEAHATPVTVLKSPPSSTGAFVKVYPKSVSYFEPQSDVQGTELGIEFSHGAFEDEVEIDHFQYKVTQKDGSHVTDWCPISKQVHITGKKCTYNFEKELVNITYI